MEGAALTVRTIVSGVVGVFLVMVFLQIMVNVGSAFAKYVETKQTAAAERKAELDARKARRAAAAKAKKA